jgi:hypothetical protein
VTLGSYTSVEEESRLVNGHHIFESVCSLHLQRRSNPKQTLKLRVAIMAGYISLLVFVSERRKIVKYYH